MDVDLKYQVTIKSIRAAEKNLSGVVTKTPLLHNINISSKTGGTIFLKREDLQIVRSFKLRGAFNKMVHLSKAELENGVVCASAGNHAQGVAYACSNMKVKGVIFMPNPTPGQKVSQVEMFGKEFVKVILHGDTFDDSYEKAMEYCKKNKGTFIHPFNDPNVIEGQGTVALEILEQSTEPIDFVFVPVGGGGLASGVATVFKELSPNTKVIGVEPTGAPSMKTSIEKGEIVTLDQIDKFVDGAAVQRVGDLTFEICKNKLDDIITVDEGLICHTILQLYNEEAIIVEPAGALTISALDQYKSEIKEKNVVCIVSGSNNDITRMEEIKERSLLYLGLKHYFIVRFPQRAGALKLFVNDILGSEDDITLFEYTKKNNRETGAVLIGILLKDRKDFKGLTQRMLDNKFMYEYVNEKPDLFQYLI